MDMEFEYQNLVEIYTKMIESNPNDSVAYNYRGRYLSLLGKHEEGIESIDKAIQLNSNYADAFTNKGNILHKMGKQSEALACFDRVSEMDPYFVNPLRQNWLFQQQKEKKIDSNTNNAHV